MGKAQAKDALNFVFQVFQNWRANEDAEFQSVTQSRNSQEVESMAGVLVGLSPTKPTCAQELGKALAERYPKEWKLEK